MSINKILNRPMFRQAALKKGHLKPIRAFDGRFIGPMPFNAPVPVGMPTGGPIPTNPRTQLMNIPQPAKQGLMRRGLGAVGRYGFSLPFYIGSDLTYKALDAGESGKNLSTGAKLTGAGIGGALTAYGASRALPAAMGLGFGPGLLALGLYEGGNQLVRAGIRERKRIKAMTPAELAEFKRLNRARALAGEADVSDEDLGLTDPVFKPKTKKKTKMVTQANPGAGRPSSRFQPDRTDNLTQADNETKIGNENVVDITKVAQNTGGTPPTIGAEDTVAEKGFKLPEDKPTEVVTDDKKDSNQIVLQNTGQTGPGTGEGKMTDSEGKKVTDDTIARARQIRDELMAGKSSQAKLVFLANLAAGLMSGTTAKAGIGGALEVFGKALGPAVNNYATVKLKEDELSNEFMQSALELAADEIAAKNDAVEYEYPERTPGIIQEIGSGGVIKNYVGALMKDGTMLIRVPGAIDQNGRQQYIPYAGTGRFKEMDFVNDKTTEIANDIDGILRSVSTADKSLKILEEAYAKDKSFGGLVGQLRITTERVTDALGDLTSFGNRVDFGDQYELLLDKNAKALVEGGEFKDEDSAKEYLKKQLGKIDANGKAITGEGKSFVDENLRKFLGDDRTSDAQNLERLAVNETILVYALANALKSKDRLTQKDIQNAKELVKVFSLGRGAKTTIRSLRALREILVDKYTSQERLYRLAGGDEGTLNNFKEAYKIIPGTATTEQGRVFGDLSQSDLLNQFGDLPK